jgi:transposase
MEERWVKEALRRERERLGLPLEVKKLKGSYYLYSSTTRWDPVERKAKKISKYIGKLTPEGVLEKGKARRFSVYEYGAARFLHLLIQRHLHQGLERFFYSDHREIEALSLMKILAPVSMSQASDFWSRLYLSSPLEYDPQPSLSPNSLSAMLRRIGLDLASQYSYFSWLMEGKRFLAFDLTSVFSWSENIRLAEKGYNPKGVYLDQVNLLLLYSLDLREPVMLKPLPGSIRDVKAVKREISLLEGKNVVFVLDRGLASYEIAKLLEESGHGYIMPLKRNFRIIDYSLELGEVFTYRGRGIRCGRKRTPLGYLYLFEDPKLRGEEESLFIAAVERGEETGARYRKEEKKFGKLAVLSNLDAPGREIYSKYKEREGVEVAFDTLKNTLDFDKVYVQSREGVYGYFFIAFNSLLLYFKTMSMLREAGMLEKVSVEDLLLQLSKVFLVDFGHKRVLSEIPKQVEDLVRDLGLKPSDLFPNFLRS